MDKDRGQRTVYDLYIKRLLDIVASIIAMGLLSPVYLGCVLAILADDGRPVLFSQERIGIGKSQFTMHKFRSMKKGVPDDVPTHLIQGDVSNLLTGAGRVIRKYSLDELPQFYDILTGKMSLVGPRCALWNQDDLISERDKYGANDIRPGLTGWAQINGRDMIDISEKAKMDGYYTSQLRESSGKGFLMDVRCFTGTIAAVIKAKDVAE